MNDIKYIYGLPNCSRCIEAKKLYPNAEYVLLDTSNFLHRDLIQNARDKGILSAPILVNNLGKIISFP